VPLLSLMFLHRYLRVVIWGNRVACCGEPFIFGFGRLHERTSVEARLDGEWALWRECGSSL
jgi:hypothetical protein